MWQSLDTAPIAGEPLLMWRGNRVIFGWWTWDRSDGDCIKPQPHWAGSDTYIMGARWCQKTAPSVWMPVPTVTSEQWQTVDRAAKSHQRVLILSEGRVLIGWWDANRAQWFGHGDSGIRLTLSTEPSAWMLLPTDPSHQPIHRDRSWPVITVEYANDDMAAY